MKKALTISIAGTVFTIEEDAYSALETYLQSIKNYFGSYPDSKEIIEDIEARIAEQLLERKNKDAVVTLDDVNKLISVMGRVEDFGDEPHGTSHASDAKASYQGPRRLYRNVDDVWVMGVASGIAAYLDLDPLITRIGFIILTFITGFIPGIVIYFILSLIIPPAETAAQKMQMRGGPVNLQSFKESMNEYSEKIKSESKSFGEQVKNRSHEFAHNIKKTTSEWKEQWKNHDDNARQSEVEHRPVGGVIGLFRSLIQLVFKLVGFAVKLAATLGIILVVFIFIALIFRLQPFVTIPLAQVVSWPVYYVLLTLAFLALILPLSLLSIIGNVIMLRGKTHELYGAIGIIGTWFAVMLIIGFVGLSYGPTFAARIQALPQYQQSTKSFDLKDFNALDVRGLENVTLVPGSEYSVVAHGYQSSLENAVARVDGNTLVLDRTGHHNFCFLCLNFKNNQMTYEITAPAIDSVKVSGASAVSGTLSATTSAYISLDGASRMTLTGSSTSLTVHVNGASRFMGESFVATTTTVKADGASKVWVNVTHQLNVEASGASHVYYRGNPQIQSDISGVARVEPIQAQ